MARELRLEFPGTGYHVINRGKRSGLQSLAAQHRSSFHTIIRRVSIHERLFPFLAFSFSRFQSLPCASCAFLRPIAFQAFAAKRLKTGNPKRVTS
jgi:hypothetical protein